MEFELHSVGNRCKNCMTTAPCNCYRGIAWIRNEGTGSIAFFHFSEDAKHSGHQSKASECYLTLNFLEFFISSFPLVIVLLESMPSLCSYVVLYIIIDPHVTVSDFKFLLNKAS